MFYEFQLILISSTIYQFINDLSNTPFPLNGKIVCYVCAIFEFAAFSSQHNG